MKALPSVSLITIKERNNFAGRKNEGKSDYQAIESEEILETQDRTLLQFAKTE